MKAWFIPITIFSVMALAPASAVAQSTNGFYASLGGLIVLPYDSGGSYQDGDYRLTSTVPLESGPGFVAAVGYETKSGIRGEIELGYRSTGWDKFENLNLTHQGNSVASGDLDLGGDLSTLSVMANGFMFLDGLDGLGGVRPYFGGGIGFAQHEATIDDFAVSEGNDVYQFEGTSSDDVVFAYQVMLGVAFPLSSAVEARLGWRYLGSEEPEFDGSKFEYGAHSVEAGILFRF